MEKKHTASDTTKQGQLFLKVKPHFNLRQTKLDVPTTVYCVYTFGSRQWKVPTGVKVYPSQWNVEKQLAIESNLLKKTHNRNNVIANKRLEEIRKAFSACIGRAEDEKEPTDFVKDIARAIKPEKSRRFIIKTMVLRYEAEEINSSTMKQPKQPITLKMRQANQWKHDTEKRKMSTYEGAVKVFAKFLKENGIPDDMTQLNLKALNQFKKWLEDKNTYETTTLQSYTKCIRILVNDINTMDERTGDDFIDIAAFKIPKDARTADEKQQKQPPLEETELWKLWDMQGLTEKETECRDIFIALCCCGQRVSDLPKVFKAEMDSTLTADNGMQFLHIKQTKGLKTGAYAIIALTPKLKLIHQRYANGFKYYDITNLKSRDRANRDLKKLAKLAGLNREISYEQKGKPMTKPLYDLIHLHLGRHTYGTRMAAAGMPDKVVGYTTGHKVGGRSVLQSVYIHNEKAEKAKQIALEYTRNYSVRETFIFSPVDRTEPTTIQQPVQPTAVPPDRFMAHHDEQVRENVLLGQQNEKLASEVKQLREQDARNKEQLQMLPSPFQTVLDEDKYMEMQKELNAYKRGIPYEIYHDESLNAELEATNLECESQYSIEEEKSDQEKT